MSLHYGRKQIGCARIILMKIALMRDDLIRSWFLKKLPILVLVSAFALVYLILVLFNHRNFATNAFDLGIFDQAVWKLSRFEIPYSSLKRMIIWGDHFDLILLLFAPFYWLWSDARVLLILQVLLIVSSAFPIYRMAKEKLRDEVSSLLLCFCYLSFIGIQLALDFDFHTATIVIAPLAWFFYAFYFEKWKLFWLCFVLCLFCREDSALIMFMFGVYLFLVKRRWKVGALAAALSLAWLYLVLFRIKPLWADYSGVGYVDLGKLAQSPVGILKSFFDAPVKRQTFIVLLSSWAFLPLGSPLFWFLAFPMFFLRFVLLDYPRWILQFHYNANVAPMLALAATEVLGPVRRFIGKKGGVGAVRFLVFLSLGATCFMSVKLRSPLLKLVRPNFYRSTQTIEDSYSAMLLIPNNASVAAQNPFVPHLSHRSEIYLYPENPNVDYIILNSDLIPYPLTDTGLEEHIDQLKESEKHDLVFEEGNAVVFRRKW